MTRMLKVGIFAFAMVIGLGGSSLVAQSNDESCQHRIHEAQEQLADAVQQFGLDSPEARESQERLEEVRRSCNMSDNDDRESVDSCQHRIHEARERLEATIEQYGQDSSEARQSHEELEEARRSCNMSDNDESGAVDSCEHRIHEAREQMEAAIQQYGEDSPQARESHERLEEARRHCNMDNNEDRRDEDRRDNDNSPPPPQR